MVAYGAFAQVYDLLMGRRNGHEWPEYLASLLKEHGVLPPQKVLDVGCGTGHISLALIRMGYRVTGLDQSASMLDQAAHNAHEQNLFLPFVQADMRDIPQSGQVHAITCACDVVNYLNDESDVSAFFQSAYQKLYPGGVLLFDVSTPYYYQHVLGDECYAAVEEQAAYILQTYSEQRTSRMILTLFAQQRNGAYKREEEEHVLTAFDRETLSDLLIRNKFTDVEVHRFGTMEAAKDTDERWQFAARRA